MKSFLFLIIVFFAFGRLYAAEWQWSVPVQSNNHPDATAYLWIPEKCEQIKAAVVSQLNMEEISILESELFRKQMAEIDIAIVWISPRLDHVFNFKERAGDYFTKMMKDLADISGYMELDYVPIIPLGHSAAASWPYYFAAWNPERTLAALSVSGQWPYFRHPSFAPDIWNPEQNVDYIPLLETMGEYEAAATFSSQGLKDRQEHPYMALSMLACPAEGHFATTEEKNEYLAFYIRKAMEYRYPKKCEKGKAPLLRPVNPTKTGWLMEKWKRNAGPSVLPAPIAEYTGNPAQAFWFFDEETIEKTMGYQAKHRNKKPQLVSIMQEGKVIPQRNTHLQIEPRFISLDNGINFNLKGVFLDTVPGGSPRPEHWTGLPPGSVIRHSENEVPVKIQIISGPGKVVNDTTFSFWLRNGLGENPARYAVTFAATHQGDDEYKPAVQQAEMIIPLRNTEGREQEIDFPEIPDKWNKETEVIQLNATSNCGLPVYYYVESGPAKIIGDKLYLTTIPPRSKFPMKVTVVAWQYGRSSGEKIQTANNVQRVFYIME